MDLNFLFPVVRSDHFNINSEHFGGTGDCGLLRLAGVIILKVSIYIEGTRYEALRRLRSVQGSSAKKRE